MESARGQKWLVILFFSAIGLFFAYFIVSIVLDKTDKSYSTRLERAREGPGSYQQGEKINLVKDQAVNVGKIQLTYRGRSSGNLLIDLVLLELDSSYTYPRQIPMRQAKKGFHVSNIKFIATSISENRLRLVTGPSK